MKECINISNVTAEPGIPDLDREEIHQRVIDRAAVLFLRDVLGRGETTVSLMDVLNSGFPGHWNGDSQVKHPHPIKAPRGPGRYSGNIPPR